MCDVGGDRGAEAEGDEADEVEVERLAPQQLEPAGAPVEHLHLQKHEEDRQYEVDEEEAPAEEEGEAEAE